MKYVNLTPHPIKVVLEGGMEIEIPPSGKVLRLKEKDIPLTELGDIKVVLRTFELPPTTLQEFFTEMDAVYIVSLPVLLMLKASPDYEEITKTFSIVAPDTGSGAVRDESGNIVGTRRFIMLK